MTEGEERQGRRVEGMVPHWEPRSCERCYGCEARVHRTRPNPKARPGPSASSVSRKTSGHGYGWRRRPGEMKVCVGGHFHGRHDHACACALQLDGMSWIGLTQRLMQWLACTAAAVKLELTWVHGRSKLTFERTQSAAQKSVVHKQRGSSKLQGDGGGAG